MQRYLDTDLTISDAYAHKCCKTAGIKSKAKHYRYKKPGDPYRIFRIFFSPAFKLTVLCNASSAT